MYILILSTGSLAQVHTVTCYMFHSTKVVGAYIVAALDVLHMYIILLKVQQPPHEVTISQFSLPEVCKRLVVHLQCKFPALKIPFKL